MPQPLHFTFPDLTLELTLILALAQMRALTCMRGVYVGLQPAGVDAVRLSGSILGVYRPERAYAGLKVLRRYECADVLSQFIRAAA